MSVKVDRIQGWSCVIPNCEEIEFDESTDSLQSRDFESDRQRRKDLTHFHAMKTALQCLWQHYLDF